MAWTGPTTRSTGDLITASIWNVDLKDNLDYLKTKEVWFEVGHTGNFSGYFNVGWLAGSGQSIRMNGRVPDDFVSLTEAKIIVIPRATQGAANWDIFSYYAANGEAYNTHSESDTSTTYNVTLNQFFEVDISGILTSLAAGDYVGVGLQQSTAGHDVNVIGAFLKYA
tara:strand:+ start:2936 stop:3436 length:501 start_codon:yes stop_codon:yes gene_type:complete